MSKTFPIAGTYPIRARVRDSKGRVATSRHNVRPADPPGRQRPARTSVFLSAITDPDGDALTYAWDADGDGAFDDGTSSFVTFCFPVAKDYEVSVRVSDGAGPSASRSRR